MFFFEQKKNKSFFELHHYLHGVVGDGHMVVGGVVDRQGDVKVPPECVGGVPCPGHQCLPPLHPQAGNEVRGTAPQEIEQQVVFSLIPTKKETPIK